MDVVHDRTPLPVPLSCDSRVTPRGGRRSRCETFRVIRFLDSSINHPRICITGERAMPPLACILRKARSGMSERILKAARECVDMKAEVSRSRKAEKLYDINAEIWCGQKTQK